MTEDILHYLEELEDLATTYDLTSNPEKNVEYVETQSEFYRQLRSTAPTRTAVDIMDALTEEDYTEARTLLQNTL